MLTLAFWRATLERVVASFVGAVLAALGGNVFDVTTLDVGQIAKLGAGAALVSLLKAILAATTTGGGPSFTNAETLTAEVAAKAAPVEVRQNGWATIEPWSDSDDIAVPADGEPHLVAGPAAEVPEGAPVDVVPVDDGTYASDTKTDAAYHGKHAG